MDIENEYKEKNREEMDIEDSEERQSLERIKIKNQRLVIQEMKN